MLQLVQYPWLLSCNTLKLWSKSCFPMNYNKRCGLSPLWSEHSPNPSTNAPKPKKSLISLAASTQTWWVRLGRFNVKMSSFFSYVVSENWASEEKMKIIHILILSLVAAFIKPLQCTSSQRLRSASSNWCPTVAFVGFTILRSPCNWEIALPLFMTCIGSTFIQNTKKSEWLPLTHLFIS